MKSEKTLVTLAIAAALGSAVVDVRADIITADFSGVLTFLDGVGAPLANSSYPYYADPTWGYGLRTQISGQMEYDISTGTGSAVINPFNFFSGPMLVTREIIMQSIGDGAGGSGSLIAGAMRFDWPGGGTNIPAEIIWDASGFFAAMPLSAGQVISGVGAIPASDAILKGSYPIGPAPFATTTFDTDGVSITGDDGIGGSPMTTTPFMGASFNLDFTSLTNTGYIVVEECPPICGPGEVPVPAAVWLFGSGLLGLLGVSRRKRRN